MRGRHSFAEAVGRPARALASALPVVALLAIPIEGAAAAPALPSIGSVVRVQTGAAGKTVVGTLTVTEAIGPGFATVYGCADGWPLASNVNFQRGWTFANRVVARADGNGELCIYLHQWAHVIWDQTAVLDDPVHAPQRLLDTRLAGVRPPDGAVVVVDTRAPGRTVQGNLTITEAAGPGYATVYPCAAERPGTSNINYDGGWTVANAVIERADAQGLLCVYVYRSAHVIWDQVSEADEPPGAVHAAVRRLDTRLGPGPVADGGVVRIQTAAPGAAIRANLTITEATGAGYATAYPCAAGLPATSNVNYQAGWTVAAGVLTRADAAGEVCVYVYRSAHVVWDQNGELDQPMQLAERLLDTRVPAPALAVELVSIAHDGTPVPGSGAVVSGHGRFVAFVSDAQGMLPGDSTDTPARSQVYVRDMATGGLERISVTAAGLPADGSSFAPAITPDGRYVAFVSDADDLVPGVVGVHVFVRDRLLGTTDWVSVPGGPVQTGWVSGSPSISADGRVVAFTSGPDHESRQVMVRDLAGGATIRLLPAAAGAYRTFDPAVSADGRFVTFSARMPPDNPLMFPTYHQVVHELVVGRNEVIAVTRSGLIKYFVEGTISAEGRYVAWTFYVDGFVETVVVADRATRTTIDTGLDVATDPSISADGHLIALEVGVEPAILRYDRVTGGSEVVSVAFDGSPANGASTDPAISPDGRTVAFSSQATNLVPSAVLAGAVYLAVPGVAGA